MSRPKAGYGRQASLAVSRWVVSNTNELGWIAALIGGAVLVAFLMH